MVGKPKTWLASKATDVSSLWGNIAEAQGRALRVVLLEDGETVHNAFFDRNFLKRQQKGEETK